MDPESASPGGRVEVIGGGLRPHHGDAILQLRLLGGGAGDIAMLGWVHIDANGQLQRNALTVPTQTNAPTHAEPISHPVASGTWAIVLDGAEDQVLGTLEIEG